jgi:NADH-quinone oxidoreductase subunit J
LLVFVLALKKTDLGPAPLMFPNPNQQGMIQNLGKVLFSEYVFPFEVISILILISLMGAVVLGRKDKKVNPINE